MPQKTIATKQMFQEPYNRRCKESDESWPRSSDTSSTYSDGSGSYYLSDSGSTSYSSHSFDDANSYSGEDSREDGGEWTAAEDSARDTDCLSSQDISDDGSVMTGSSTERSSGGSFSTTSSSFSTRSGSRSRSSSSNNSKNYDSYTSECSTCSYASSDSESLFTALPSQRASRNPDASCVASASSAAELSSPVRHSRNTTSAGTYDNNASTDSEASKHKSATAGTGSAMSLPPIQNSKIDEPD